MNSAHPYHAFFSHFGAIFLLEADQFGSVTEASRLGRWVPDDPKTSTKP
jgi:hypothetical protein